MRHATCVLLLTACTTAGATPANVLLTLKTVGEHFHTVDVELADRGGEKGFTLTNGAKDSLDALAPHASGVALAEVAGVNEFDMRGVDGDKGIQFKLKRVRGSGFFQNEINLITEVGGLGPGGVVGAFPSVPPPGGEIGRPPARMKPDSLKKGERYWFAFGSHDASYREMYYQGVIAFWPEKDKVSEVLEAAVTDDIFRWSPVYVPGLKLSYGHVVERDTWRVRVERDGKALWEKTLPGKRHDSYKFGLSQSTPSDFEVPMPKCGHILFTESDARLETDNEFGLPAGQYLVNNGFDPETGKRHGTWIEGSGRKVMNRAYDPNTGKPIREQWIDSLTSGGKAVGAAAEQWLRKIERTIDASGKVTKEEVYRYDGSAKWEKRWVRIRR